MGHSSVLCRIGSLSYNDNLRPRQLKKGEVLEKSLSGSYCIHVRVGLVMSLFQNGSLLEWTPNGLAEERRTPAQSLHWRSAVIVLPQIAKGHIIRATPHSRFCSPLQLIWIQAAQATPGTGPCRCPCGTSLLSFCVSQTTQYGRSAPMKENTCHRYSGISRYYKLTRWHKLSLMTAFLWWCQI